MSKNLRALAKIQAALSNLKASNRFQAEFMEKQVFEADGLSVDTDEGTFFLPDTTEAELDTIYGQGNYRNVEAIHGWFGRYSAPGYLDATDYIFCEDREACEAELERLHGTDEGDHLEAAQGEPPKYIVVDRISGSPSDGPFSSLTEAMDSPWAQHGGKVRREDGDLTDEDYAELDRLADAYYLEGAKNMKKTKVVADSSAALEILKGLGSMAPLLLLPLLTMVDHSEREAAVNEAKKDMSEEDQKKIDEALSAIDEATPETKNQIESFLKRLAVRAKSRRMGRQRVKATPEDAAKALDDAAYEAKQASNSATHATSFAKEGNKDGAKTNADGAETHLEKAEEALEEGVKVLDKPVVAKRQVKAAEGDEPKEEKKANPFEKKDKKDEPKEEKGEKKEEKSEKKEDKKDEPKEKKGKAGEIEILKDGKVIDVFPDAFGDDSVSVIKFFRQLYDISPADDKKAAKAEKKEDKGGDLEDKPLALPKVEEPKEEKKDKKAPKAQEPAMDALFPPMAAAKAEDNFVKVTASDQQELDTAKAFFEKRVKLVREIVASLVEKNHVVAEQSAIDSNLLQGKDLTTSVDEALKLSADRKFRELQSLPDAELLTLKASLPNLKSRIASVDIKASKEIEGGHDLMQLAILASVNPEGKKDAQFSIGSAFGGGFF